MSQVDLCMLTQRLKTLRELSSTFQHLQSEIEIEIREGVE